MKTLDKDALTTVPLHEIVAVAGGSMVDWSRWISGARDIKASSLFEPAQRLGLTPGELLDVLLLRRIRRWELKMEGLEAQMDKSLPGDRLEVAEKQIERLLKRKRSDCKGFKK